MWRWSAWISRPTSRTGVVRRGQDERGRKSTLALRVGIIISLALALIAAVAFQHIKLPSSSPAAANMTGWSTAGASILTPSARPYVISGVTWYGIETPQYVPYGLNVSNYTAILDQIKANEFNTLRIPLHTPF